MSLFTSPRVWAQSTDASIIGQVTDAQGKNVPDAAVEAVAILTNVKYDTKTNSDGIYSFPNLPPTDYRIVIKKDGFREINKVGITLHVQDTLQQNFQLAVGSVTESITVGAAEGTNQGITVYGEAENINTTDATVSTTIDRNFAENLPLNGRSFQTLILLAPGTALTAPGQNGGTFSVNGQRTNTNNFTVDGVSANLGGFLDGANGTAYMNGANPNLTIAGTTQGMVSVDALQEFKIQTSTYAPEFGRQPGGQVSLLTRSGTNAFHGTAFDYLRNTAFDANNWFNDAAKPQIPKGAERQNDFGGTIGGPIFKDNTFFFISYEGLRLLQPFTTVYDVPSLTLRQQAAPAFQPLLNFYPTPNGADNGDGSAVFTYAASQPTTLDSFSIRIDHTIGSRFHIFGRYFDSSSRLSELNTQAPGNLHNLKLKSPGLTLGTDIVVSPRINNEFRINYAINTSRDTYSLSPTDGGKAFDTSVLYPSPITKGADAAQWNLYLPSFTETLFEGPQGLDSQRQLNITDSLSYSLGPHQVKFGVDYRRQFPIYLYYPAKVNYTVSSEADLNAGNVSLTQVFSFLPIHPILENFSAFAQDTWRISNRLTLTYGLRWELNPTPGERDGLNQHLLNLVGIDNPATASLAPAGSPIYKTTYRNFAPRLGFAYRLRQSSGHETVLRAGAGVFYDLNSQTVVQEYAGNQTFSNGSIISTPLPFPAASGSLTVPPVPAPFDPPYFETDAVDPNLQLPYTLQWNVSVEQGLGLNQSLTTSYVASVGRRLLQQAVLANFGPMLDGVPEFGDVFALRNASSSNYQSLQVQYNRRLSAGLQALLSYTYSHSIDNSSDGQIVADSTPSSVGFPDPNLNRGNSDFDLRHSFRAAGTYIVPTWHVNSFSKEVTGGWSMEAIGLVQSGMPTDLIGGWELNYWASARPDVVPNEPFYIYGLACAAAHAGRLCPGGMGFNPAAFALVPVDSNGFATREGTLGRNVIRGFGMWQADFAIHRQFNLTERVNLQFRGEAFNIFNHPNFANINHSVGNSRFGLSNETLNNSLGSLNSLYQIGGPRSVQLALKLAF